ncbi:tetratricopeptide repeat protein [Sulfitobacter sp. R18_1]|uniref:tetratricopeptide repeat protein n=1 Tax=Sulfitobacter sp. R18_1 TaxID=2821104 RepID=UPI001ADB5109|nr:tetratricopeptide repeat protein [Sulfitobacter sp. R18_1]MBO9428643.1 hypothetical protein [Sulfitobacter sp. R18_1]
MKRKALVILLTSAALITPVVAGSEGARTHLKPVPKPGHIIAGTPAPIVKPDHIRYPEAAKNMKTEDVDEAAKIDVPSTESETIEDRMARIMKQTLVKPVTEPKPTEMFGPATPTEEQLEAMRVKYPAAFTLSEFHIDNFAEDKERLEKEFSAAGSREPDAAKARLDLARFYLAHRMIPEGHSIVSSINADDLEDQQLQDYKALMTAFSVLDDRRDAGNDFLIGSEEHIDNWQDYPFWAALHHVKNDSELADKYLKASFEISKTYPEGYLKSYIPTLLEAALDAGKWTLAKEMAVELEKLPGMKDSSTFQFLIGLAADKAGRQLDAFDAYRKATMKDDVYAQRARIAIVDLGVKTQAMSLEDARKFLEVHRKSWRGDEYEIEILKRLAVVTHNMGDLPASLGALGDIIATYPTSAVAEESKGKAKSLLNEVYDSGVKGEITLSEFTKAHEDISRKYHFFDGFAGHHAAYAQHLADLGATAAAAREFSEAAEYLEVVVDLKLYEDASKDNAMTLRLKQAKALYDGGQKEEAASVLQNIGEFEDPAMNEEKAQLAAKVFAGLDKPEEVINSLVTDRTDEYVRLLGEAYWAQGNWNEAKNHYLELQNDHPNAFGRRDAIRLLLSAHRDLDRETAINVAENFPEITDEPEWKIIAKEINKLSSSLTPLSEDNIAERVIQADEAMKLLEETKK